MVESETEKKSEEKARLYLKKLEEKLEYYKNVVINSNDAVIIQDFEGIVKAWNKGAERIYGFKEKEMLGKSITKIIAPKDLAEARKNINSIKQGNPTFKIKQTRKTKDKREVFVIITYSPIYEKEELIEIATTEEDISELKKSLENLKESEEKYRRLFETSKEAVLMVDAENGKIEASNPYIQSLLGYSGEELIGKQIWQISPLKDIAKNKAKFVELKKKGYVKYNNLPLLSKLGDVHYVEFVSNLYLVGKKKVVQCNIRDITETYEIEKKIKESEEKYHNVVEKANDGIAIIQDMIVKYGNPALAKIRGDSLKNIIGNRFIEFILPEELTKVKEYYQKRLRGEKVPSRYETVLLRKDRGKINVELNAGIIQYQGRPADLVIIRDITERKKAEEKINLNSLYVRSLIESNLDPLVALGKDGKITDVNKATEEATGISRNKLIGTNFSDYFTDPEKAREGYKEAFKKGQVKNYSLSIKNISGKITDVIYNASIFKDKSGNVKGVFASARDITERKKTEEELRESEENFRKIFEHSSVGISIVSLDGKWLQVNPALCKMVGYSKKELLSKGYLQLTFPEDIQKTKELSKNLISGKKEYGYLEKRYITKNKEIIWVHLSVALIHDLKNTPQYFIVHTENITERKKAEEYLKNEKENVEKQVEERTGELKESEEKFKHIFNSSPIGLILVDEKNNIAELNPEFYSMLKCGKSFLGESIFKLHLKQDYSKCRNNLALARRGKLAKCDCDYLCKGGCIMHADSRLSKIIIKGKEFVLISVTDVTREKEAEKKLKDSFERLKELDIMKTEFLSMTSHELKTPLTPMRAQLQRMLSKEIPKEEQKKGLEMILRNEIRLERLINEILEISRIESKKLSLSKQLISIREIIKETVLTMEALSKEKNIKIEMKMIDLNERLFIDKYRIEEVLINLLDNAIKHSNCSRIEVSSHRKNNNAIVCVKDNGKGISKGNLSHLFEPFYQVENMSQHKSGGTGLGLAICKAIVESHSGKIWAESELGKGTTFCFSLPFKTKEIKVPDSLENQKRGDNER